MYEEIEDGLQRVNGIKTLISHTYYDEETFWRNFYKDRYTEAKRLADPRGVFRDLYTKTCRASQGYDA